MNIGTRVKWAHHDPQEPNGSFATIVGYYEATPNSPFEPVVSVRWDSGEFSDEVRLDDLVEVER